jgi:ABC-type xylose transport system permease subunit
MSTIADVEVSNAGGPERRGQATLPSRIKEVLPEMAVPALLVLTFVIFGILKPDLFLTWTNVRLTIGTQATTLLLAIAATITLRAGDFDLSVAGVMIFSAALVGVLYKGGVPAPVAVAIALACGTAVGLVNSVFVVLVGLDSLIVSLGMFTLLGGITTYMSGSNLVNTIPLGLQSFANHQILQLPLTVWIGWVLAFVLWVVFEYTPLGRYLLFIGGNRAAGTLAGLRVNRLRFAPRWFARICRPEQLELVSPSPCHRGIPWYNVHPAGSIQHRRDARRSLPPGVWDHWASAIWPAGLGDKRVQRRGADSRPGLLSLFRGDS